MNRPDLERLQALARRDDWHAELVGSDVREVIAYALQLEAERAAWEHLAVVYDTARGDPDCE